MGEATAAADGTGLGELLDELVAGTPAVRQAVLLTPDGFPSGASRGMPRREIDRLAAVCAGMHRLAGEAGDRFGAGAIRRTVVMLDDAFLLIAPTADGGRLAALADIGADVPGVARELALLGRRVAAAKGVAVPEDDGDDGDDRGGEHRENGGGGENGGDGREDPGAPAVSGAGAEDRRAAAGGTLREPAADGAGTDGAGPREPRTG
jgi:predicted regulator of Ras-like GTPase activity (Roadblock/LC7/MglB family)